jgi:hypothetical protein
MSLKLYYTPRIAVSTYMELSRLTLKSKVNGLTRLTYQHPSWCRYGLYIDESGLRSPWANLIDESLIDGVSPYVITQKIKVKDMREILKRSAAR